MNGKLGIDHGEFSQDLAKDKKHEFALYVESLSSQTAKMLNQEITISDEQLMHRMKNVLRLQPGDKCVFFDRYVEAWVCLVAFVGKKHVQIAVESVEKTLFLQPTITFMLPLLKRDDYQSALYSLAEVGVSVIQLVFTQKTGHQWSDKDNERAQRIVIGAAEQSKNFAYPEIKEPISLESALNQYANQQGIFFDAQGKGCFEVMQELHKINPKNIVLLIGPEGDLTIEEKKMVKKSGFDFCALTPTVVRSVQAAALGAGLVRSVLVSTAD